MANSVEIATPPMNSAVLGAQARINQNATIRAGRDAIIANRETYITRLDTQTDEQFEKMVRMAPIYVLYPKVVDGFSGTVFAKAPVIKNVEFNDKQKELNKNCDMLGNSIDKFSERIINTVFEDGFCATMNDYSDAAGRPFMQFIAPHQFISFRTSSVDGYPVITQFIYKEEIEVDNDNNEFDSEVRNRYIVLDIKNENYRVRRYLATSAKSTKASDIEKMVQEGEDINPKMDGNYFKTIPITIHGINQNNFSIGKSPLQDISDMNISVIQRVIDQVYMLHWTALPTPWVTGVDEGDAPGTIGPSKAWTISNSEANVGMLEFSGNSARAHQDFIDNLKDIMASMGAQILKKEGVSRETATSVLVRAASQTSLISTLVNNVSGQVENSLKTFLSWGGTKVSTEFTYELNDDFIKIDMEPNAQIALVKSWLDGAISHRSMFNKMKEGELIDTNTTFEEEIEEIKKNPPPYFQKVLELANAIKLHEKTGGNEEGKGSGNETKGTKGSNLDNGNINNKQTD
jgi:hypothetical protein